MFYSVSREQNRDNLSVLLYNNLRQDSQRFSLFVFGTFQFAAHCLELYTCMYFCVFATLSFHIIIQHMILSSVKILVIKFYVRENE